MADGVDDFRQGSMESFDRRFLLRLIFFRHGQKFVLHRHQTRRRLLAKNPLRFVHEIEVRIGFVAPAIRGGGFKQIWEFRAPILNKRSNPVACAHADHGHRFVHEPLAIRFR